jgi:hypothetical protein
VYKREAEVLRPVSSQSLGYILNASGILVSVWLSDLQVNINLLPIITGSESRCKSNSTNLHSNIKMI